MTEWGSHGGDTPQTATIALAAPVQELAVAALHGGEAVLDEPDRLAAARRRFPAITDGAGAVEGLGNLSIACPGKMTIESTDHRNETLTQTCRDRPGARNRTSRTAIEATIKAQQSGETVQDVVVQGNESRHRCASAHSL